MIEPETLEPRPDYWNSVLWKRLMGAEVYAADVSGDRSGRLRAYAHATPGPAGSMTVLLINLDPARAAKVALPQFEGEPRAVFALDAPDLYGRTLRLNGAPLLMAGDGALPLLDGVEPPAGTSELTLPPLTYAFVVLPRP
jgi:hypothetical protein